MPENFDRELKSETEKEKEQEEPLFYDEEQGKYLTREEFFNPPKANEPPQKKKMKAWMKVSIAIVLIAALMGNVLAVWPQLFNLPAIEFIEKSRQLADNEEVQSYKDSIVVINGASSKGTGFLIGEESYVVTNSHVIDGEVSLTVTFEDGARFPVEIAAQNEEMDIAILSIGGDSEQWQDRPVLPLTEEWGIDQTVYVIGNPLFFNFIANEGELLGEWEPSSKPESVLRIEAPIYRGSSGSPVITEKGEVAAVVYATTRIEDEHGNNQRVGLAIKSKHILELLEGL